MCAHNKQIASLKHGKRCCNSSVRAKAFKTVLKMILNKNKLAPRMS